MIASGYSMRLHCEQCNRIGIFCEDETRSKATQTAKRAGWMVDWPSRRAWCPPHRKEGLEALGIGTVFRKGPRWGKTA